MKKPEVFNMMVRGDIEILVDALFIHILVIHTAQLYCAKEQEFRIIYAMKCTIET
jgi:hypothetical protein